jgi:hypothetical protein
MPEQSYDNLRHELLTARATGNWKEAERLAIELIKARPSDDCLPTIEPFLREARGELQRESGIIGRLFLSFGVRFRPSEVSLHG